MKKIFVVLFLSSTLFTFSQSQDSVILRKIYDQFLTQNKCYDNLRILCKDIGGRLSGSPQAAKAVEWTAKKMREAGADSIIFQPCMVPRWERGQKEKCQLYLKNSKTPANLSVCALGSSEGTGAKGVRAPVIVINNFEELEKFGEAVKGRIVFYNVYFDHTKINTGEAYGKAVVYRAYGASKAAKYGAVAMIVRSVTSATDDEPHTGNMRYDTLLSKNKIPAFAVSYKGADDLLASLTKDPSLEVYLESHCRNLAPVQSFNVVGQITGTSKPKEFIIAGGHLDSWDNGEGAHDDGSGIVQCIGMLEAFKKTGIKPKHSIRAVAFMNEENGLAGGIAYAEWAKKYNEKHLAGIETDAGGYSPRGFGIDTTSGLYDKVLKFKDLFIPYNLYAFDKEGGGADLQALEKQGVPGIGFDPDTQRYFDIHHTAADTFDKVNKRELSLGGAAITSLVYLLDQHL